MVGDHPTQLLPLPLALLAQGQVEEVEPRPWGAQTAWGLQSEVEEVAVVGVVPQLPLVLPLLAAAAAALLPAVAWSEVGEARCSLTSHGQAQLVPQLPQTQQQLLLHVFHQSVSNDARSRALHQSAPRPALPLVTHTFPPAGRLC